MDGEGDPGRGKCDWQAQVQGRLFWEDAQLAAKDAPIPVHPVDSRQVGVATGYAALSAAEARIVDLERARGEMDSVLVMERERFTALQQAMATDSAHWPNLPANPG